MRTLFDTEEEEEDVKASEITLSTASLLGIFFGLVLICGVFFGFGYSMGRGSGHAAQARSVDNIPATNSSDAEETASAAPPPAAASAPVEQPPAPQAAPPAPEEKAAPPKEDVGEQQTPAAPQAQAVSKPSAVKVPPAYIPAADASPTATGKPMVQIAAVARPEDAYVLVNALRQRGYGVTVRSEPQDKLLHVQVGPFADVTQAAAMRQKLLSDGYNAIIKQ